MGFLGDFLRGFAFGMNDSRGKITWYCDGCNSVLNKQAGFNPNDSTWTCTECGFENDITDANVYESTEAYQEAMGIPRCPICGGMVEGDAPDAKYWFNCKSCGERFCLEDGELITMRERSNRHNEKKCSNCGQSLRDAGYTGSWEDGNNSDGYIECPHCGHVNFL